MKSSEELAHFDGLSLAWAIAQHLAKQTKACTLFATHYFEMTDLPKQIKSIANVHLDAIEQDNTLTFLYRVCEDLLTEVLACRSQNSPVCLSLC